MLFDNVSSARQVREIRRRLAKSPDDPGLRLSLADLLVAEGKNEEALSEWMKAHLQLPFDEDARDDEAMSQTNARAHYVFGLILANKGVLEEATRE